jgi:methionine synthase II (cobalamin-independent)
VRTPEIVEVMISQELDRPFDANDFQRDLRAGVHSVVRRQAEAGVDIISDGEIRRESYSNKFANALDGIDRSRVGEIVGRTGNRIPVPIVSGPITRREPVEVRDVAFLRANTTIAITARPRVPPAASRRTRAPRRDRHRRA